MSWLEDLQDLLDIRTGSGSWNALAFIVLIAVIGAIVYIIRNKGEKGFTPARYRATPFFSGNAVPAKLHIRGTNSYWGIKKAFEPYYDRILAMHTGDVNDYIFWFVAGIALAFIVVVWL